MQRRRNSHIEGLATHDDPESCGHARKDVPEALTGAHAGRVLSLEKEFQFQVPRWFWIPKATPDTPPRQGVEGPGVVEDPEHAWKHFVREPGDPATAHGEMEPWAAMGSPRTQAIDERSRESDRPIVPMKFPNNGGRSWRT